MLILYEARPCLSRDTVRTLAVLLTADILMIAVTALTGPTGKKYWFSQPQSITQKGVHARPLTAREREHWFLKHLSHFPVTNFGRQ